MQISHSQITLMQLLKARKGGGMRYFAAAIGDLTHSRTQLNKALASKLGYGREGFRENSIKNSQIHFEIESLTSFNECSLSIEKNICKNTRKNTTAVTPIFICTQQIATANYPPPKREI